MSTFYSQKGQDQWVMSTLGYKRDGYFVDLAASDGINLSNTYTMERSYGWNGLLIEPNPDFYNKCKQNRCSVVIDAVVDDTIGRLVSFRTDNMELGGIVADDTDNSNEIRGHQLTTNSARIRNRTTTTLEQLLLEHDAPRVIDYLSLDIEGAETRALRNFPFHLYTFLTITIERPTEELEQLLFKNEYHFVMKSKRMGFDSFYVHDDNSITFLLEIIFKHTVSIINLIIIK
jgi:FkbM family methyltransferase